MASVVLDAGVLLARILKEPLSPHAQVTFSKFHEQAVELHAPTLIRYEIVSVIRKALYQRRLTSEEAYEAVNGAFAYPIVLHFDDALLRRALDLAESLAQPRAYDTQYIALAERLQCEFWTTDARLFNSAREHFPGIRWIGNVPLEPA